MVNGLGDHLMMLPVVRALSHAFRGRIVLAALPVAQIVFAGVAIERFVPLRLSPTRGARAIDVDDAVANIGSADILVSLNRTCDDGVLRLAERIGAGITAGLFPEFTIHVPFDQQIHSTDLAFTIARRFDDSLELETFSAAPAVGADAGRYGREFAQLFPPGVQTLIVHADTSRDKEWRAEHLQQALDDFLSTRADFVSVVLGVRDVGLQPGATGRILSAVGVPLDISLALVAQGTAFLGVDSAMLHAADLCRLPSVALFGPGDSRQFGCRFCRHEHIAAPSMAQIAVASVLQALDRVVPRA